MKRLKRLFKKVKKWLKFKRWDFQIFMFEAKAYIKFCISLLLASDTFFTGDRVFKYRLLKTHYDIVAEKISKQSFVDPRVSKPLKRIRLVLDRLIEDDYLNLAGYKYFEEKWGQCVFVKNKFKEEFTFKRENEITPEDARQKGKDLLKLHDKEDVLRQQDIDYLTLLLKKHERYLDN